MATPGDTRYELLRTGKLISEAIDASSLTTPQVAAELGVSRGFINALRRGARRCSVDQALYLEMLLGRDLITAESILIQQVHDELYDARHGRRGSWK